MNRTDRRELDVYIGELPAGTLFRSGPAADVRFRYDEAYRQRQDATPLSLSLPLSLPEHPSAATTSYLWGLMPDNAVTLSSLAERARTSAADIFGLIRHVGRDVAGAAQFLPPGQTPSDEGAALTELDPEELASRIADLRAAAEQSRPARYDNGRWSLAGAQAKIALRHENGRWFLPEGSEPSTHIVKPAVPGHANFDVHEAALLQAAASLQLAAAETTVIALADATHALVSVRYDRRRRPDGRWIRVHQEDLCQALKVPPSFKYEAEGGPGVARISRLLANLPGSASHDARSRFFDALAFTWAVGATDGHAKNYSLLLSGGAAALAPLYDVGSALPYTRPWGARYSNARKLHSAFKIGNETAFTRLTAAHWITVARQLLLDPDEALARARLIITSLPGALIEAYTELADKASLPATERTDWSAILHGYHSQLQPLP